MRVGGRSEGCSSTGWRCTGGGVGVVELHPCIYTEPCKLGGEYSYFFSFIIHYVSHQENKRFPPETLTELTESRSQLCQQCAKSRLLVFC